MYNESHLNYSHSDIYDNGLPGIPKHELGEVLTAKTNLERQIFLKRWKVYPIDDQLIQKSFILPPQVLSNEG